MKKSEITTIQEYTDSAWKLLKLYEELEGKNSESYLKQRSVWCSLSGLCYSLGISDSSKF